MKIIYILILITTIYSCCDTSDECDVNCNDWEECYQTSDANVYCHGWSCRSIIDEYWGEYLGNETFSFNNGTIINNEYKAMFLDVKSPGDEMNSRKIHIGRLDYSDSISYNYINSDTYLVIEYINPSSKSFNIPKQTVLGYIYKPSIDSIIKTNILFEGIGNIDNSILNISCSFEYENYNGSYDYTGPNSWF